MLDLLQQTWLWTDRGQSCASSDTSLVFVVRKRIDLLERVIPFFEAQPLLSSKQVDFSSLPKLFGR